MTQRNTPGNGLGLNNPLRTWEEVIAEYNLRNPNEPIKSPKTARYIFTRATKKIRKQLAGSDLEREYQQ